MNKKLEEYKLYIKDKKVAVLGLGVSNKPLIKYLAALNVDITAFDMAEENDLKSTLEELEQLNINYHVGKNYLQYLKGFDVIFKTPKVRYDIPELINERNRGAEITSEMEVFLKLCPAETFAVTGSDGKTTTTTLIYKMLVEAGYKCWLGGNIGTPLLDNIDEISPKDKVVLELSSFQLHTMSESPNTAIVTNLSPNHLDVHKDMDEYIDAKKNIFLYQSQDDKLIINYDNAVTRNLADQAKGNCIFFSRLETLEYGVFIKDGIVVFKDAKRLFNILKPEEILLIGKHNLENYMAAIAAVIDYVSIDDIRKVAKTFGGVEHRMELVRKHEGIAFYNDSMASSPTRTIAGLKSFNQKVILIAGGYDKNIPYDEMGSVLAEKVKLLVLIGQTGPKIEEALKNYVVETGLGKDIQILKCGTMALAVQTAYDNAVEGDAVVMSPASASFDMFKDFAERGNMFKEAVNILK
ncbi:MAG: UDP-N-acetylmuramoylalanine--D-glutamate ligase [Clostridia bacterium]|nr:UDP-N-acetylmuramoylalanine--D-glutamate ligase [Clostridia bacterium]